MNERPLETFITLVLEHADKELSQAHGELYPERIPENIPLSLTLLYPWIDARSMTDGDLERLCRFFAGFDPLEFDLTHLDEFPGQVVYVAPEPDEALRSMMKALWEMYPEYPPYGEAGGNPPPHCTLGRLEGEFAITMAQAAAQVEPLLPVRCEVQEATLMEEYAPDRCRVRETFPLGR